MAYDRVNLAMGILNRTSIEAIETLDKATAIVSAYLAQKSVNILRVHDVKGHKPLKIFGNFTILSQVHFGVIILHKLVTKL